MAELMDRDDKDTLIRLDERTVSIQSSLVELKGFIQKANENFTTELKVVRSEMENKLGRYDETIDNLRKEFSENFVRKDSFTPVQRIVYGIVAICATSVVGAVLSLVLLHK